MNDQPNGPGRRMRPAIEQLQGSWIRVIADANLGREGVIPLWFGEPDQPTPQFIKDNHVFYAQNRGIPSLREVLSDYMTGLYGRSIGTERITATVSGMSAIMLVSELLIDAGDNMIVVGPIWPNCRETVHIMGGEARDVLLKADETGRWQLDLDELKSKCDERTRGIFINSPGNPTGWVMHANEQRALLDFCREHGIYVVADEVYVRLAYDRDRAPSFLDIAEPDDRLIVINSFSKSWSMTGWRLGWLTHPEDIGTSLSKLNEFNIASPPTFIQHAGVVAVRDGEDFVRETVERYRRNRDLVFQRLAAMPRVTLARPEGAFYAFFALDGMTDSVACARELIEKTGVGLAPGLAFGQGGEGWMRLCFAADAATLSEALDRLEPAFS
ncbi:MAG: pyridoxal phosphate-dependent aminotransferase [Alphaproteobacteria bacterium]